MNETQSENGKATRRRVSRKVRLAIAAVALVGLGTAIGVVATEVPARARVARVQGVAAPRPRRQ